MTLCSHPERLRFQSTCPARGTTSWRGTTAPSRRDFNPRAPRGARRGLHSPTLTAKVFQSTCPARGTTVDEEAVRKAAEISIHVPREGHDRPAGAARRSRGGNFNPRAPRGARRISRFLCRRSANFNPRAPRGARHGAGLRHPRRACISIHVPREGHDNTEINNGSAAT